MAMSKDSYVNSMRATEQHRSEQKFIEGLNVYGHTGVNMKQEVGQSPGQREYSKEEWWPGPPAVQPQQAAGEKNTCAEIEITKNENPQARY